MIQLTKKFRTADFKLKGLITLISLAGYFISSYFLEKNYVLSKFPVPYFEQQTSFDAVKMKAWYASMLNEGTFNIYLNTQFIDFIFITTVILAGYTLWAIIAQLHPMDSLFNKWGEKLAFALPLAGLFDILENLVSFFMIANPANFSDTLVIPYSTFAVLKFGCWTVGLIWLAVSIVALLINLLRPRQKVAVVA